MDFINTKAGLKFITHDFPRLVKAVEQVAEKLPPKTVTMPIPAEQDNGVLRDFFNGYFNPGEDAGSTTTEQTRRLTKLLRELEAELKATVSPSQWCTIERYCTALAERDGEEMEKYFEAGFRAATQLIIAGLTPFKEAAIGEV